MQVPRIPDFTVVYSVSSDNFGQKLNWYDDDNDYSSRGRFEKVFIKELGVNAIKGTEWYYIIPQSGDYTVEYYMNTKYYNPALSQNYFSDPLFGYKVTSSNVKSVTISKDYINFARHEIIPKAVEIYFTGTTSEFATAINNAIEQFDDDFFIADAWKVAAKNKTVHCTDGDYIFE